MRVTRDTCLSERARRTNKRENESEISRASVTRALAPPAPVCLHGARGLTLRWCGARRGAGRCASHDASVGRKCVAEFSLSRAATAVGAGGRQLVVVGGGDANGVLVGGW